jgi:hypothetical protein
MRGPYKRWTLLAAFAAILVVAFLSLTRGRTPVANAVAMTFVGYTNDPNHHSRFALFSVSNQAPYAVRWRDRWAEVEGKREHNAITVNPSLPGLPREPALKAGGSFQLAVGEPLSLYDSESGRWRFAMLYAPYSWRERWFDFSVRHKLPLRLGPVTLVDARRLRSPSNDVTVTTAWLTK